MENKKEDWKNMCIFATHLLLRTKKLLEDESENEKIMNERIAIMHLDHATELLMKAFLFKEGYFIYDVRTNTIKEGIKIKDLPNCDKLLNFRDCLKLVSKIIQLNNFSKINDFRDIRNEIQHRAKCLPLKKREKIKEFCPALEELCIKMFPEPEYAPCFREIFKSLISEKTTTLDKE